MSTIRKFLKKFVNNPFYVFFCISERANLNWIPDELFLKLLYRSNLGKKADLKNPKSFNEKLQWLKLYDRKDIYTTMVDKYAAKQYVTEILGEEYIIPTLGVWDRFEDIDFDRLPNQFVLKCTHDSGGLCICRDKRELNKEQAKRKLEHSLATSYYWSAREWPYKNVEPRIICEKYMENPGINGLRDYKFYCFHGKVQYLYVSEGMEDHTTAKISFATPDWQLAPFGRSDYAQYDALPPKPERLEEMIAIAERVSKDIPFLRVDLYEIDGKIYFSEFTFSPCAGFMPFSDDIWDLKLGALIELPVIPQT